MFFLPPESIMSSKEGEEGLGMRLNSNNSVYSGALTLIYREVMKS